VNDRLVLGTFGLVVFEVGFFGLMVFDVMPFDKKVWRPSRERRSNKFVKLD